MLPSEKLTILVWKDKEIVCRYFNGSTRCILLPIPPRVLPPVYCKLSWSKGGPYEWSLAKTSFWYWPQACVLFPRKNTIRGICRLTMRQRCSKYYTNWVIHSPIKCCAQREAFALCVNSSFMAAGFLSYRHRACIVTGLDKSSPSHMEWLKYYNGYLRIWERALMV